MRRFKSAAHLQRFATVQGLVLNLFHVGRHMLRAVGTTVARPGASNVSYPQGWQ